MEESGLGESEDVEDDEAAEEAVAPAEQSPASPHGETPRGATGDPVMTLRVFDAVRLNIRSTRRVPIQVVGLLKH